MSSSAQHPYAIAMWDFSWLERRWPGAGYEDWNVALGQLAHRGYNAVRIDAYPHLISADAHRTWRLEPMWTQTSWGAQSPLSVTVLPSLIEFIRAARRYGIVVALSTWYRDGAARTRETIVTPADQARIWRDTLRRIEAAGLLDSILYVDLCNEFPQQRWAAYTAGRPESQVSKTEPSLVAWMRESIAELRNDYPTLAFTYSFHTEFDRWQELDVGMLDLLEVHTWMAGADDDRYNKAVGYGFERFAPIGFDNLARNGRREYEANRETYDALLFADIDRIADWSRAARLPVHTTEGWAVVDYKDWPGLDWDWILDLNARAVEYVASKGRWTGIATSNFCGPQFVGMWREVEWHQQLTTRITSAPLDEDLLVDSATADW
ncbi:cellulase-like family protein [Agreia sp.]|uniref:cellulase-like family protein n=1 Tax=Agreia sp. TaxID=1872416 RepID=UPI0035BC332C